MAGSMTHLIRSRRGHESGLSLIEIIIALFVFMLGVLGIFAIIPIAMHQSAVAVRTNRAGMLAQMAVAMAQYQLRSVHFPSFPSLQATAGNTGANTLTDAGTPGWQTDAWVDYFVTIAGGNGIGQARRITANTNNTLTCHSNWVATQPTADSSYRIATFAVDSQWSDTFWDDPNNSRGGLVGRITDSTAAGQLPVNASYTGTPPVPSTYFILITSGRGAGRVCALTGASAGQLQASSAVNFYQDGVRQGDSYYLIGNGSGIVSYPGNNFGTAGTAQTVGDPSSPSDNEYRYTIVVSDTSDMPGIGAGAVLPVRIDALVFRNYDGSKTPAENKKAVGFLTAYVSPF